MDLRVFLCAREIVISGLVGAGLLEKQDRTK